MTIAALRLYDQSVVSDPEAGTHGDCFRACIRTLCQSDMEHLPHPVAEGGGWNLDFFDVLERQYGLSVGTQPYRANKDFGFLPRIVMAAGTTVRTRPDDGRPLHSGVWDRVAGRMVHDPHPSRAGLISIVGFDWVYPE